MGMREIAIILPGEFRFETLTATICSAATITGDTRKKESASIRRNGSEKRATN
jgi:hypothetical protein